MCIILGMYCQKRVSRAGISNCIPQNTVECKYLSLPEITASEAKVLILTPVLCTCPTHNQTKVWIILLNMWSSLYLETISEWDTWMNVSVFMSLTLISKPLSKQWSIFSLLFHLNSEKYIIQYSLHPYQWRASYYSLCISLITTNNINRSNPADLLGPFY